VSRWQNRCISTAAAFVRKRCGVCRMAQQHGLPGSDRSTGSGRAVSTPGVSYSRRADPAALLAQRSQCIELLVVKLGPAAHSEFADLFAAGYSLHRSSLCTRAFVSECACERSANSECAAGASFTYPATRCTENRLRQEVRRICSPRVRNTRRGNGSARSRRSVRSGQAVLLGSCRRPHRFRT